MAESSRTFNKECVLDDITSLINCDNISDNDISTYREAIETVRSK